MSASVALVQVQPGRRTPTVRNPNNAPAPETREDRRRPSRHEQSITEAIDLSLSAAGEEIDELFPLKTR